jgi:hypothetical protein
VDVQVGRAARQQAPVPIGLDVQYTTDAARPPTRSGWSGRTATLPERRTLVLSGRAWES